MFEVLIGQSEDVLEKEATEEVLSQIRIQLGQRHPQAGILLCSIEYDHGIILDIIHNEFSSIDLVGCTTDGELCSNLGFTDDSLVLILFVSDVVEIKSGSGFGISSDGTQAGEQAALQCVSKLHNKRGHEKFAIILADPISAGISGVDVGIKKILGENFPVFGGVAAAHSKQRKTSQFIDNTVATDSVVLLLFAGDIHFSFGIKGGHSPLGLREAVGRVEKNTLYTIGQRTAYEYFRHYIGDSDIFMNYCLAVFPDRSDDYYVLSAPKSDPEKGSVSLNGCVPDGAEVQIGTADRNVITKSCFESIQGAIDRYPGKKISVALFFSCAGRKMIMGTKVVEEYATARRLLPSIPFAGFYCYGEFGPVQANSAFRFHGTTFVTLLIGE
ncbi:FIST signal transduction protein [Desulfovibrio sp. TomC]|uniref:FIST signal transduction protein n=1 Tax=Desulfovibrio sp. TomC TaxID=1562888 RepID=UPI0018CDF34F|nr:FIST N-terminal domain-containing protein [Desulfovibrio sp. TomC]